MCEQLARSCRIAGSPTRKPSIICQPGHYYTCTPVVWQNKATIQARNPLSRTFPVSERTPAFWFFSPDHTSNSPALSFHPEEMLSSPDRQHNDTKTVG